MRCFRSCFGRLKRRKPRKSAVGISPPNHIVNASEGVRESEKAKEVADASLINLNKNSLYFLASEAGENEVYSPVPSRCSNIRPDNASLDENVDFVRNPIENDTRSLNAAKVMAQPPVDHPEKENTNHLDKDSDVLISPEPTFCSMRKLKEDGSNRKHVEGKITVNTSLSNWLVESETTPKSVGNSSSIGNSPMWSSSARSYEDRPILGALTLEELRQFSAFSTQAQYRSRSPEEIPIIGTVGRYWSHTEEYADSIARSSCSGSTKTKKKLREDERVNCNSTPFLERLDTALASNSPEV